MSHVFLPRCASADIADPTESLDQDDGLTGQANGQTAGLPAVCEYCRAETGTSSFADATHRSCPFHSLIIDLEIVLHHAGFLVKRVRVAGLFASAQSLESDLQRWKDDCASLSNLTDATRVDRARALLANIELGLADLTRALMPSVDATCDAAIAQTTDRKRA